MSITIQSSNDLLSALSQAALERIHPKLESYALNFSEIVYDQGQRLTHVYFIESGIVSMLVATGESSTMEVAMVGSEGMVALPVFLGVEHSNDRAVVQ